MRNQEHSTKHKTPKSARYAAYGVIFSVVGMIAITAFMLSSVVLSDPTNELSFGEERTTTVGALTEPVTSRLKGNPYEGGIKNLVASVQKVAKESLRSVEKGLEAYATLADTNVSVNIIIPPDTDTDGIPDSSDNCIFVANPLQIDTDTDTVGDLCDNCRFITNPSQTDSNANCPASPYASDPLCGDACEPVDTDGDSVIDSLDNCPTVVNPLQIDADSDGVGNLCDNCRFTSNASQTDTDANCPALPYSSNPLCGDACQPSDVDDDGIPDVSDNCPNDANPLQIDADSDGVGNVCDNCRFAKNSGQADTDNSCPATPYASDPLCGDVCQPECTEDADCEVAEECSVGGECVDISCSSNDDCPGGTECSTLGICVETIPECTEDVDCDVGEVCSAEGICETELCATDADCPGGTFCSESGLCEELPPTTPECTEDSDCPDGEECSTSGTCEEVPTTVPPGPECTEDADCPDGGVCSTAGICGPGPTVPECTEDTDCPEGEFCSEEGVCEGPVSQCSVDAQCLAGQECSSGSCQVIPCENNTACLGGTICGDEFYCEVLDDECVVDADCGLGEICEDGTCNVLECETSTVCPGGTICSSENICVEKDFECEIDAECDEGQACLEGSCVEVECLIDFDCVVGSTCQNNSCVFGPDICLSDAACEEGEICVQGDCVDIPPDTCEVSSDCPNRFLCRDGICQERDLCLDSLDCFGGDFCQEGLCFSLVDGVQCESNDQCLASQICTRGGCDDIFNELVECRLDSDCAGNEVCSSFACQEVECFVSDECPNGLSCVDFACRESVVSEEQAEGVRTLLNRILAEIFTAPQELNIMRLFAEPTEAALPRVAVLVSEKVNPNISRDDVQQTIESRQILVDQQGQRADVTRSNQLGVVYILQEQFKEAVDGERATILEVRHPRLVGVTMKLSVNRLAVLPTRLQDLLLEASAGNAAIAFNPVLKAQAQEVLRYEATARADRDGVVRFRIPVRDFEPADYGVFALASKDGVDSDLVVLMRFNLDDGHRLTFTTWVIIVLLTTVLTAAGYSRIKSHIEDRKDHKEKQLQKPKQQRL